MTGFIIAQAEAVGQIEQIARTFGVNWPHLTAQIVSFSIVCALLYVLAYRPILQMLDLRRTQIARGLANTERIEAELARTKAQRQEVLSRASLDAARLLEKAKAAAAIVRVHETERAAAEAERIISQARESAERDRIRVLREARRDFGRLVVQTAAAVTGKVLTDDDQRRLVHESAQLVAP